MGTPSKKYMGVPSGNSLRSKVKVIGSAAPQKGQCSEGRQKQSNSHEPHRAYPTLPHMAAQLLHSKARPSPSLPACQANWGAHPTHLECPRRPLFLPPVHGSPGAPEFLPRPRIIIQRVSIIGLGQFSAIQKVADLWGVVLLMKKRETEVVESRGVE